MFTHLPDGAMIHKNINPHSDDKSKVIRSQMSLYAHDKIEVRYLNSTFDRMFQKTVHVNLEDEEMRFDRPLHLESDSVRDVEQVPHSARSPHSPNS